MTSQTFTINAKPRERVGSRYAQRVRQQGGLPAVLYGHGEQPLPIAIDAKEAVRHILAGEKVFNISIDASANETVLLKDIQYDYMGRDIIHVDLERVDLNERVSIHLPVHLKGEAVGLKTAGSVLIHPTSELSVSCMVKDIIEHVDVDISALDVGGVLHASDVKLPDGYELETDPESVIATIHVRAKEEEVAEEGAAVAEGAEPEVISDRKKDEAEEGEKKE